jgi:signal transduction histidine kinase
MADDVQPSTEKSLRSALEFAQSIVDTVREPLLVLDGQLRIQTASHAFYQDFHVSAEETEGRFLYEIGNGQWNIPQLRTALAQVLPNQEGFRDFEVMHDFGPLGRRVMLLNARGLWQAGHQPERVLLAIEDITERKRLEEKMLRSNEALQRFAYIAAHDLRSPLNTARNLTTLLAQELEGRLSEAQSEMLSLSLDSLNRLSALMNDLLSYSEINQEPRQMTLVPIEESLGIALANLQHHVEAQSAEVSIGDLPDMRGDRTQIAMVFQNLIGNALKYRREPPPVIRIEAVRDGHFWRFSVADNGQGFDPQYAVQIFEPFKRLHGREVPGSGIGLATCKRIVERAGGRQSHEAHRAHQPSCVVVRSRFSLGSGSIETGLS